MAKYLPMECLSHYDSYLETIKSAACVPCTASLTQPDYIQVQRDKSTNEVTQTTVFLCDYYAKQIYAPGQDPNDLQILTKPTKAFDQCGWNKYSDLVSHTKVTFASEHTTTAEAFF